MRWPAAAPCGHRHRRAGPAAARRGQLPARPGDRGLRRRFRRGRHATSLETLRSMVAAGAGYTLLPALAVPAGPDPTGLTVTARPSTSTGPAAPSRWPGGRAIPARPGWQTWRRFFGRTHRPARLPAGMGRHRFRNPGFQARPSLHPPVIMGRRRRAGDPDPPPTHALGANSVFGFWAPRRGPEMTECFTRQRVGSLNRTAGTPRSFQSGPPRTRFAL